MKIFNQENTALSELRAENDKLKKERLEAKKRHIQEALTPKAKAASPLPALLPLVLALAVAIGGHFYCRPQTFSERMVFEVYAILLIIGGAFLSLVVYDKIK